MFAIRIVATMFAFVSKFIPLQCIILDSILPAIYRQVQEQMIRNSYYYRYVLLSIIRITQCHIADNVRCAHGTYKKT